MFHIIYFLNPDFKLVNNLISSSLDKVTTGTYNLQLVITSVAPVGALSLLPPPMSLCSLLVITQFTVINSKDTSQLINGIFSALQKFPKYFYGIANSISFVPALFVLLIILFLYLSVFELTTLMLLKLSSSSSLLNSSI